MSDATVGSSPFGPADLARAAAIIERCRARGWSVTTAESCTGGLVAALLTEVPGASAVIDRGFVTYSNEAKTELLGVPPDTLSRHGAVSPETAGAMAHGALARSQGHCAVSVTGIAGPGGGSASKPVGLVHFGLALADGTLRLAERRFGDLGRASVRQAALHQALTMIEDALIGAADPDQAAP